MTKRLTEGYSNLKTGGSHLVFCHAGVVQNAFISLGIHDFMVANCGVASFIMKEDGTLSELVGFWDPPVFNH
jgi:hypothetical protein